MPGDDRSPRRSAGVVVMAFAAGAMLAGVVGTAVAQSGLLNGKDIRDRSIPAGKLARGAVGTFELRPSAVTAQDIRSGAVTVSKLRTGAVTGRKIAAGAVGTTDVADGAVTRDKLSASARVPSVVVRKSVVVGVQPGGIGQATATCQAGEVLVAGGGGPIGTTSDVNLVASRPEAPDGAAPTRWQIVVENETLARPLEIQAEAICARS